MLDECLRQRLRIEGGDVDPALSEPQGFERPAGGVSSCLGPQGKSSERTGLRSNPASTREARARPRDARSA